MASKKGARKRQAKRNPMTAVTRAEPHDSSLDGAQCGAARRAGGACARPAGWGTDHAGIGRCKLHGGATPVRHGRFSTVKHEALRELIAKHEADPDPLNVLPELAAARALFEDFVNRHHEITEALLAWYASWSTAGNRAPSPERMEAARRVLEEYEALLDGEPTEKQAEDLKLSRELFDALAEPNEMRPRQVLDISDAMRHIDVISKVIDRVERARSANAISRPELTRILNEMARVVDLCVQDEPTRQRIRDGFLAIRL